MARRKKKKYHFIYKITNVITEKFYIGMHSTDNLNDRYLGSGKRLRRSLNKYGKENHKLEILEFLPDRKSLKEREKEIVNEKFLNNSLCMNLQIGGEGGSIGDHKIKWISAGSKAGNKKLSLLYANDEWKEKVIKKIADSLRKDKNPFFGRSHSEETKKLMSQSQQGKHSGEKNSQFGTCWITKEGINKKINKEELQTWIQEGWVRGRKI